jgi:hypothetical protein
MSSLEVIVNDGLIALTEKFLDYVTTDVARAPGHEYVRHIRLSTNSELDSTKIYKGF